MRRYILAAGGELSYMYTFTCVRHSDNGNDNENDNAFLVYTIMIVSAQVYRKPSSRALLKTETRALQ
jgi:hypothetical protein